MKRDATGPLGSLLVTGDVCPSGGIALNEDREIDRRSFLLPARGRLGISALSYGRIIGANDRISLGQIGVGRRGRELASVVADMKGSHNVEMTAVCDLGR